MLLESSTRPPLYNPEDYATSLRRWTAKGPQKVVDEVVNSSQGGENEMSLRQFLSVSDLLSKLKIDLRLAYASFVQEFVCDPIDGATLLLELLRIIQQKDSQKQIKVIPSTYRRSLLEENSCLQCLQYCLRCDETVRRLAMNSGGLYSLAVCILSSVRKSRILSLELLSNVCSYSTSIGHTAVSEAMSNLRLHFGEPVRFRFLVSMLNGATSDLLLTGLRFINTFLETSSSKQIQLYIQAELDQAGLNTGTLKKMLPSKPRDRSDETISEEFNRWSRLYINVQALKNDYNDKCKETFTLKGRIAELEAEIKILEAETKSEFEKGSRNYLNYHHSAQHHLITRLEGGNSTPGEDEGISSSEQDDLEEMKYADRTFTTSTYGSKLNTYNNYEPTIDDVILDFINTTINDVQRENYFNDTLSKSSLNAGNKSLSKMLNLENETKIVPALIIPEPPKKSCSLHTLSKNIERNSFFDDESMISSNFGCISRYYNVQHYTSSERYSPVERLCESFQTVLTDQQEKSAARRSTSYRTTSPSCMK